MNKSNIIQQEMQRAQEKAATGDSFIARNYWLWVAVAFFLYPLASLLSAFTEGSNVWFRLSATGAPTLLVGIVVAVVVFLVEVSSYILGKGAIDDVQAGVFSKGSADVALWAVKTVGFMAVMGFSVYLSLNGAPLLNEKLRESYTPATASYASIDSIQAAYNAEVAPHQANIERMQKTTWKGAITRDANRSISKSQDIIAGIEQRRTDALAAANAANANTLTEWEDETATNSAYAMSFAGLGEILKLFCLIFIGLYDQGLSKEAAVLGGKPTPSGPTNGRHIGYNAPSQPFEPPHANRMQDTAYPTRNPIGFRVPEPDTGADNPVATCSYKITDTESLTADELLDLYRKHRSKQARYKQENYNGDEHTRLASWTSIEEQIQEVQDKLKGMGYVVALRKGKYQLLPATAESEILA